eukprot:c6259_g1_i1.p1 GENE.c6259_g1_i1~~c6259_g1_i1.p1  ORF type:complete len:186 (-),score=25.45 c6259_g1_i1:71-628(-)
MEQVLTVLRGGRNGITYGAKIRFPHALVMVGLFAEGSLQEKLSKILELTFTHARNLCCFVTLYKALLEVMRKITGKKSSSHSAVAGAIGGYLVFGTNSPVNQQINLYLLSRIIFAGVKLAASRNVVPAPEGSALERHSFSMFAAVVWAVVMWMFEFQDNVLQPSLRKSMKFLYWDSNNADSSWWP